MKYNSMNGFQLEITVSDGGYAEDLYDILFEKHFGSLENAKGHSDIESILFYYNINNIKTYPFDMMYIKDKIDYVINKIDITFTGKSKVLYINLSNFFNSNSIDFLNIHLHKILNIFPDDWIDYYCMDSLLEYCEPGWFKTNKDSIMKVYDTNLKNKDNIPYNIAYHYEYSRKDFNSTNKLIEQYFELEGLSVFKDIYEL